MLAALERSVRVVALFRRLYRAQQVTACPCYWHLDANEMLAETLSFRTTSDCAGLTAGACDAAMLRTALWEQTVAEVGDGTRSNVFVEAVFVRLRSASARSSNICCWTARDREHSSLSVRVRRDFFPPARCKDCLMIERSDWLSSSSATVNAVIGAVPDAVETAVGDNRFSGFFAILLQQ